MITMIQVSKLLNMMTLIIGLPSYHLFALDLSDILSPTFSISSNKVFKRACAAERSRYRIKPRNTNKIHFHPFYMVPPTSHS